MKEAQVNWLKTLMQSAKKNAGGRMRRPIQIVLIGTLLAALGLVISGCDVTGSETSGVSGVTFQWTSPSYGTISGTQALDNAWWNQHAAGCEANFFSYAVQGLWGSDTSFFGIDSVFPKAAGFGPKSFSKNVYVPASIATAGGSLQIVIYSYDADLGFCNGDSLYQWSEIIAIPPYSRQVYANLFTHASPAGEAGTIIDARLSSGGATPYTYAFTPSNCAGTNAPSSGPPLPNGEASVAPRFSGTCTVTVTDAKGTTSTASVPVTAGFSGNTGSFSFSNGSATISVTNLVSGGTACVDLSGGANYQTQVPLVWNGSTLAEGSVGLLATTPGIHEITAQVYSNPNENCANPTQLDFLQTIADLYQGNGVALVSARRAATAHGIQLLAAHPKRYTATSSLRFAPKKTVKVGTENLALGQFKGGIVNGAFTWTSPRRAKGITRPAGLSALVHGTYVMQSNAMYFGPPRGDATALIGTGTVLFRGIGNSYECAQITSTPDGSVLTLLGGQGTSAKLNGSVTTTATVTYKLPFFTKKAKPPLPKASGKTGTVIASTGRKGLALPTICRNLKKYLP